VVAVLYDADIRRSFFLYLHMIFEMVKDLLHQRPIESYACKDLAYQYRRQVFKGFTAADADELYVIILYTLQCLFSLDSVAWKAKDMFKKLAYFEASDVRTCIRYTFESFNKLVGKRWMLPRNIY
jgi:hypothetical protein